MKLDLTEITTRIFELNAILVEKQIASEPNDGSMIRISNSNRYYKYYLRQSNGPKSGKYMPKSNLNQVQEIAQQNYDADVVKKAQTELDYLQTFLDNFPGTVIEDIYPGLHPARQALITPVELPDDEFLEQWLAVKWDPKPFYPDDHSEYYNKLGVRMKSKQETILSDRFIDRDVPQRYEFPIQLKGMGEVHPDFMLLNKRTRKEYFWEHFGLWDNFDYRRLAIQKLAAYQRSGIYLGEQLIVTFETAKYHPSFYDITQLIDHYLV